jgi:S-disulfanyl-L-cysteine oxidoreductase SoxD
VRFQRMRSSLLIVALSAGVLYAQQARSASDGVYTAAQAMRGQQLYEQRCAMCHGNALDGGSAPPLAGSVFLRAWSGRSLWELASKIRNTMPADDPGKLTPTQSTDLVAFLLQTGKFPVGRSELPNDEAGLKAVALPGSEQRANAPLVTGNMQQLMAAILFPSSNIIFNVQTHDPGEAVKPADVSKGGFSWTDWGAGIYGGWTMIDNAAIAISESAPLLLTPRRCQNGRPAPVDRPDWIKFTQDLAEAGRAAYRASQTRNQETVSDVTNQLADACQACHRVYRDKRRPNTDPSDKSARCIP